MHSHTKEQAGGTLQAEQERRAGETPQATFELNLNRLKTSRKAECLVMGKRSSETRANGVQKV